MYNVSTDYKSQINKQVRNPSYMRVKFGIIDPDAVVDADISSNGVEAYSDPSGLPIDVNVPVTYDTLELNKFILDRIHVLAPDGYGDYQGYVSSALSDGDCVYAVQPKLIVDFDDYYTLSGFSLRFDEVRGEFPSRFRIQCFNDLVSVYDNTFDNDTFNFVHEEAIPLHNKIEVTFIKSDLPYKRVRLHYFGFGVTRTMLDDVITRTEQHRKVDLLSTVLPKGDFNFTFLDVAGEYDPDNPTGLYQYLEELQPVKFEYGYELDDESIEWVQGGINYTSGEVSTDSSGKIPRVTFKTTNSLAYLTDLYIKGVYSSTPVSLYDLAVDVMDGQLVQYEFDDALKSIYTKAPMPKLPIRECLQLIANASQSVLDVDRNGKIVIKRVDLDQTAEDFNFDFSNMYNTPVVSKYPPLKNVNTSFFEYVPRSVSETISEVSINVSSPTEFYLEYPMSNEVSLAVDGTLSITVAPVYYAEGCVVTLNGSGTVTITGKPIDVYENTLIKNFNSNGEDCNVVNDLINDQDTASDYADWVGLILLLKNEYSFENRGYPEVDIADLVLLDTLYSSNLKTVITENKISYTGTLKASSKVFLVE